MIDSALQESRQSHVDACRVRALTCLLRNLRKHSQIRCFCYVMNMADLGPQGPPLR